MSHQVEVSPSKATAHLALTAHSWWTGGTPLVCGWLGSQKKQFKHLHLSLLAIDRRRQMDLSKKKLENLAMFKENVWSLVPFVRFLGKFGLSHRKTFPHPLLFKARLRLTIGDRPPSLTRFHISVTLRSTKCEENGRCSFLKNWLFPAMVLLSCFQ